MEEASLNEAPEIPFGVASPLVTEELKLLFSWLAIGEVTAAIFGIVFVKILEPKVICVEICKQRAIW